MAARPKIGERASARLTFLPQTFRKFSTVADRPDDQVEERCLLNSSKQASDGKSVTTEAADKVELKPETLLAYELHIASIDSDVEQIQPGDQRFLWADACPEKLAQLRKGTIIAELYSGKRPIQVPDGLIHDWIGAIFIPGATIERTLAVVQDYDNHKNTYQPEVIASKLIGRQGNDFQICLRLRKRKIITVILDTYHDIRYFSVNPKRWVCQSRTSRISEVEDAGKSTERGRPHDTGRGFLWRLSSYWRFDERDDSTFVECRAISLTRDIPTALAWIIEPIILKLPRESLKATLESTRRALALPEAMT